MSFLFVWLIDKSGSHTILVEKDGIYMSYGLFGGVLTTIVLISAGVCIGVCFYHGTCAM